MLRSVAIRSRRARQGPAKPANQVPVADFQAAAPGRVADAFTLGETAPPPRPVIDAVVRDADAAASMKDEVMKTASFREIGSRRA